MKVYVNNDVNTGGKKTKHGLGSRFSRKKPNIGKKKEQVSEEQLVKEEEKILTEETNVSLNTDSVTEDIIDEVTENSITENTIEVTEDNDTDLVVEEFDNEIIDANQETISEDVIDESSTAKVDKRRSKLGKNKKGNKNKTQRRPKKENSIIVDLGLLIIAVILFIAIGSKVGHIILSIILP